MYQNKEFQYKEPDKCVIRSVFKKYCQEIWIAFNNGEENCIYFNFQVQVIMLVSPQDLYQYNINSSEPLYLPAYGWWLHVLVARNFRTLATLWWQKEE